MAKITIVSGASGVGKSTFIKDYQLKNPDCHVLDLPAAWLSKYGDYAQLLNLDEGIDLDLYCDASDKVFFALEEGRELVMEYNMNGEDDELFTLLTEAENLGIKTNLIVLDLDADLALQRVKNAGPEYFPSLEIKERVETIFYEALCSLKSQGKVFES